MEGYSEIAPVWIASVDNGPGVDSKILGAFATPEAAKKYITKNAPLMFALNWEQNDREYSGAPKMWIAHQGIDTYSIQQYEVLSEDEIA